MGLARQGRAVAADAQAPAGASGPSTSASSGDEESQVTAVARGAAYRLLTADHRGTPAYSAPELFHSNGAVATAASDVYSFGVTCCTLFRGMEPYIGCSVRSVASFERKVLRGLRPELPDELRQR